MGTSKDRRSHPRPGTLDRRQRADVVPLEEFVVFAPPIEKFYPPVAQRKER